MYIKIIHSVVIDQRFLIKGLPKQMGGVCKWIVYLLKYLHAYLRI